MPIRDNRPTLLLLHGGGIGPWSYDRHVAALSVDFRCLVPLLPAHSTRAHEPFTFVNATKEVADLLESEGGPAFVAGLSLGGQLALALAADRPDLVTGLFVTGANTHGIPMLGPALALTRPLLSLKNNAWLSRSSAKRMSIPPEEWPLFLASARTTTTAALSSFLRASGDFRAPDGLRSFDRPVLVVRAEKEAGVIKRSVPEVTAMLPAGTSRMVPKLAHPWPLQDPELFVEVCRSWFLDGQIPKRLVSV